MARDNVISLHDTIAHSSSEQYANSHTAVIICASTKAPSTNPLYIAMIHSAGSSLERCKATSGNEEGLFSRWLRDDEREGPK